MRQQILDYIGTLNLGGFSLSQELPYTTSGEPMYMRNPKKLYVDNEQVSLEGVIYTLDGSSIANRVISVTVYFSADAKQLPPSYNELITDLSLGKDITTVSGTTRRDCIVSSEYANDMLVTELEFRFTKLN